MTLYENEEPSTSIKVMRVLAFMAIAGVLILVGVI